MPSSGLYTPKLYGFVSVGRGGHKISSKMPHTVQFAALPSLYKHRDPLYWLYPCWEDESEDEIEKKCTDKKLFQKLIKKAVF